MINDSSSVGIGIETPSDILFANNPSPLTLDLQICNEQRIGYYNLGGLHLELNKKPCWLHRFTVRLALGWEWNDA